MPPESGGVFAEFYRKSVQISMYKLGAPICIGLSMVFDRPVPAEQPKLELISGEHDPACPETGQRASENTLDDTEELVIA
jgi:hypothetical protein